MKTKMTDIYTAFDELIIAFGKGEDLETCLSRYPDHKAELRPMIESVLIATTAASAKPDVNSTIRAKNRVLAAAATLGISIQQKSAWQLGINFINLRAHRMALSLSVAIAILFTSGVGLVQASNGALPGDNLYGIKRSWEGLRLFFVVDHESKEMLINSFDEERFEEIKELYSEKRFELVTFNGIVEKMDGELWTVSGIEVKVESEAVGSQLIEIGSPVQIIGETEHGIIEAETVTLQSIGNLPKIITPIMQDTEPDEPEFGSDDGSSVEMESTETEKVITPEAVETKSPEDDSVDDVEIGKDKTPEGEDDSTETSLVFSPG